MLGTLPGAQLRAAFGDQLESQRRPEAVDLGQICAQHPIERSYAQELVTARSGGGLKLLDAIDECNALNDLGHTVCAIELSPFALSRQRARLSR